jgi:hypothetical protein
MCALWRTLITSGPRACRSRGRLRQAQNPLARQLRPPGRSARRGRARRPPPGPSLAHWAQGRQSGLIEPDRSRDTTTHPRASADGRGRGPGAQHRQGGYGIRREVPAAAAGQVTAGHPAVPVVRRQVDTPPYERMRCRKKGS